MHEASDTREILVEAERVRVEFGKLVAVNNVSLKLRGGDLLGLIGPNGAGKTTLLRAMCGHQPLTSGRVRIMGGDVVPGAHRTLRHVGFTPDNPPVYKELSVREFLRFVAKGYTLTMDQVDERIDFWLEQVWLKEKADNRIKQLSRGMHQRIGIARTMLPNPPVVLLDEPAAGLDPAGRVQFRQLLCSLRDQGKAIIVSSHILSDLKEYCTHVAIMAHGQIVQFGTVSDISSSANGDRCRYKVGLARPFAGVPTILEGLEGVADVQAGRHELTLEYASNREAAAVLLAHLVREGVPVSSFTASIPDLEDVYLRTGIRQVD